MLPNHTQLKHLLLPLQQRFDMGDPEQESAPGATNNITAAGELLLLWDFAAFPQLLGLQAKTA